MTALALVSAVNAQEKKPGIPEAQQLMERARQAKEAGRMDEARELAEKARQIGEMHHGKKDGRPGFDKERAEHLEQARRKIEELQREGKHEEAEQLKRRIAGVMAEKHGGPPGGHDGPPGKPAEGPAKIRHLMEAIRNLREAGLNEPAESLEKVLHKMKEDFERRQKEGGEHARGPEGEGRRKEPPHPGPEAGPRRGAPQGPGAEPNPARELHAIREQVEKLSRAVEELRAQVNRRNEGGEHKEHGEIRRPGN